MGQPAHNDGRRGRELVAGLAVALAVTIAVVAVPVVAVRGGDDEGALAPSLPILVVVAAVAIAVALLALYRIALERASRDAPDEFPRAPLASGPPAGPVARAPVPNVDTTVDDRVAEARPRAEEEDVAAAVSAEVAPAVETPEPGPQPPAPVERPPERAPRREAPRREAGGPPRPAPARPARARPAAARPAPPRPAPARRPATRPSLEPVVDRAPEASPASETDDEAAATEMCEIVWWHGARRGGFEARIVASDRRPRVAERSRTIAWRDAEPPPPEGPAADAHSVLVDRLVAQGWQPDRPGPTWYGLRFRRKAPAR